MIRRLPLLPAALSILAGIVSWELVRHFGGGRREAWDDPVYWQAAYPLLIGVALLHGIVWRNRPWRWGTWMLASQAAWALAFAIVAEGGIPNLVPLGLLMFALLSLPCIGESYLGAWIGRAAFGTKQAGN